MKKAQRFSHLFLGLTIALFSLSLNSCDLFDIFDELNSEEQADLWIEYFHGHTWYCESEDIEFHATAGWWNPPSPLFSYVKEKGHKYECNTNGTMFGGAGDWSAYIVYDGENASEDLFDFELLKAYNAEKMKYRVSKIIGGKTIFEKELTFICTDAD